jgi:hypothetical protein
MKSLFLISCSYRALLDVVEITNTTHKFAPLLYSCLLSPTCFGSSLPSSGSFWNRLIYVKIQIDIMVYHTRIMWLSDLCVGVSWFSEESSSANVCIVLVISTTSLFLTLVISFKSFL